MTEGQRNEPVSYKYLRLLDPNKAYELTGIPYESPVFVSPFAEANTCVCGKDYTPVTYAIGEETRAQHLHQENGGVYFYRSDLDSVRQNLSEGVWTALLEPYGTVIVDSNPQSAQSPLRKHKQLGKNQPAIGRASSPGISRAESVIVTGILTTEPVGQLFSMDDGTLRRASLFEKMGKAPVCLYEVTDRGLRFSYPRLFPSH